MRLVVVGMGVQGPKRVAAAGADVVTTVDTVKDRAAFRTLQDVALDRYDAAALCVPDGAKLDLMEYLARHGKHALVEKPVIGDHARLSALAALARKTGAVCYTAYNHRFEPHFVRMKALLCGGDLGRIYALRLFYGNGTARLVRNSPWRDRGSGVLRDLGSHLLDAVLYWLGEPDAPFVVTAIDRFENSSPDHVVLTSAGRATIQLEMTLLSWRNQFSCDVLAEHGSAHIEGLCKWGPATFRHRRRVLPSGHPTEEAVTLVQDDPTWDAEYRHFKARCAAGEPGNLDHDIWISTTLERLYAGDGA